VPWSNGASSIVCASGSPEDGDVAALLESLAGLVARLR